MSENQLGSFIRLRRNDLGLSQGDLARRIGTSKAYMNQIESGKRQWPQKYIGALARELNVTEADLARYAGKISPKSAGELEMEIALLVNDIENAIFEASPQERARVMQKITQLLWDLLHLIPDADHVIEELAHSEDNTEAFHVLFQNLPDRTKGSIAKLNESSRAPDGRKVQEPEGER